jgi:ABC-type nitrate/sulfonate/bicarbonate transport system permease component
MNSLKIFARAGRRVLGHIVGIVLLVAVWEGMALRLPPSRLATPAATVGDLFSNYAIDPRFSLFGFGSVGYGGLLYFTIRSVVEGAVCGGALGFMAGLALARTERVRAASEPVVITLGTVPILAVMPLFVIWFGVSTFSATILVGMYTAILVAQYSMRAAENVNPIYEARARTAGAGRVSRLFHVLVPAVLPEAYGGFRVALAFSWGLEVFAEVLGAPGGLGQGIEILANLDDVQGILAIVLLIGIVALLADGLLMVSARAVFRWR